jgi:hypothetical protein
MSSTQYLWFGAGTLSSHRGFISEIAASLLQARTQVLVNEGKEPSEFWDILGGYHDYAHADYLKTLDKKPRLFECTFSTGDFNAEEIPDFNQDDLCMDYVYILDTRYNIYIWLGSNAPYRLYKASLKVALEYSRKIAPLTSSGSSIEQHSTATPSDVAVSPAISTKKTKASASRTPSRERAMTKIYRIRAGHEPLMFTCHFHGWIGLPCLSNNASASMEHLVGPQDVSSSPEHAKNSRFSYATLLQRPLPEGVDAHCLPSYLSEEDFTELFGMSSQQFAKLPEWIQNNHKREVGLF